MAAIVTLLGLYSNVRDQKVFRSEGGSTHGLWSIPTYSGDIDPLRSCRNENISQNLGEETTTLCLLNFSKNKTQWTY